MTPLTPYEQSLLNDTRMSLLAADLTQAEATALLAIGVRYDGSGVTLVMPEGAEPMDVLRVLRAAAMQLTLELSN